jgi:hypothetical protein
MQEDEVLCVGVGDVQTPPFLSDAEGRQQLLQ